MSALQFLSSLGTGAQGVWDFPLGRIVWKLQVPVRKTSAASGQEDSRTENLKALCQRAVHLLGLTSSRLEVEASALAIRKADAH